MNLLYKILFLFCVLTTGISYGQDRIILKDGYFIDCKVILITPENVFYKEYFLKYFVKRIDRTTIKNIKYDNSKMELSIGKVNDSIINNTKTLSEVRSDFIGINHIDLLIGNINLSYEHYFNKRSISLKVDFSYHFPKFSAIDFLELNNQFFNTSISFMDFTNGLYPVSFYWGIDFMYGRTLKEFNNYYSLPSGGYYYYTYLDDPIEYNCFQILLGSQFNLSHRFFIRSGFGVGLVRKDLLIDERELFGSVDFITGFRF